MVRFDDLWRKYVTYSGGEQLFGLEVTEYPDLQRIRKELNLLQKLYGLYNDVLEKVGGYYDTPWRDIDIDVINTELIDFQNKSVASPTCFTLASERSQVRLSVHGALLHFCASAIKQYNSVPT